MNTSKYTVVIACDQTEGEEFAAWLNANGHVAMIGNSTGAYVNGVRTSSRGDESIIFGYLWDSYCDSI